MYFASTWLDGIGIQFGCEVAPIFQQFNPCQGGTEPNIKRPPGARFAQGGAQAIGGVTQKPDLRHASEPAAFPVMRIPTA